MMATTSIPRSAREIDPLLGPSLEAARSIVSAAWCAFVASPGQPLADRATHERGLALARAHMATDPNGAGAPGTDPAVLAMPVAAAGYEPAGTLVAGWEGTAPPTSARALLEAFAGNLGQLLLSAVHEQPSGRAYEALFRISTRLHGEPEDLEAALSLIVTEADELLSTDLAWLALVDPETQLLSPAVTHGNRDARFLAMEIPVGRGVGGVAVAEHRPIIIEDYPSHMHDTSEHVRRTVLREGVVSLICAPMFKDEMMVGALYVANRTRTPFSEVDAALLSALAAQASVAIENQRLYEHLSRQNELLEQSFAVHRELTQVSLEGVGLTGIGAVLARLIGHPIVIEQTVREPRVVRAPADTEPVDGGPSVVSPITADGRHLGTVEIVGATELTPLQTKALEHGVTVLAFELVKQRAATEVEWRLSGELLEELLDSPGPPSEALTRRAAHRGVDVRLPHRVLVLTAVDDEGAHSGRLLATVRGVMARRAPGHGARALSVKRGREVVLALPPELEADAEAIARAIQDEATPWAGRVSVGIGPSRRELGAAFKGAAACVMLAHCAGGQGTIVHYDTLGQLRFLLDAADVRHAAAMVREPLDAVIEYDAASRGELLPTLRAFVECDGHHARTADRCHIAVSTLKYRLAKLKAVLGRHPSDPELRFQLRLAFKLLDLLEATGLVLDDLASPQASLDTP